MAHKTSRKVIFGAAQAALLALMATGAHAASPVTVNDTRVFPESITATSDGTLIIPGSEKGVIYKAAPGATTAQLWITKAQSTIAGGILGVFADEPHGVFYVCDDVAGPPRDASFKAFDLTTGALKASYPFPGGGACNDFAATADGTLYITDTPGGRVLRLKPGATALEAWKADPVLVGIDGIAFAGGKLYVNNVSNNLLQRIDINADGSAGAVTKLTLSGTLSGPDGMRSGPNGTLLIAENKVGNLTQAKIDGDNATLSVVKGGFGQLTAIAVVGNIAWVTESRFSQRNDANNKDPGPWVITPVTLP